MKWLLVLMLMMLLNLSLPVAHVIAAEDPDPDTLKILQAEADRISAMNRLAQSTKLVPAPPRPADAGSLDLVCGTTAIRRVDAASAEQLVAALANAQPGDLIHLADGVYRPPTTPQARPTDPDAGSTARQFVARVDGTAAAPITLCGSRDAILESGSTTSGYGFTLKADYWLLAGFTVRNAAKGIVVEGGNHNILRGLEVAQIGDEGIHLRGFSSDNRIEQCWVHDLGLRTAFYGEGIYIGSAHSNWQVYSGGQPDASDRNQVIGNLIGPNVTSESIDVKEGTTGGIIRNNIFLGAGMSAADSWVDLKGNDYTVSDNVGSYNHDSGFKRGFAVSVQAPGWGQNNTITNNFQQENQATDGKAPFRAMPPKSEQVSIVLPGRALVYTLDELLARFPASFERVAPGSVLIKEHIVVAKHARLELRSGDVQELRLLSSGARFVSVVAFRGELLIAGTATQRYTIRSWDPAINGPDLAHTNGRAYVLVRGGRMDIDNANFSELGFGIGHTSGAGWQGLEDEKSRGTVTNSHFERNYYGAYTYQAEAMHWVGNVFADNFGYGFDPHDFSNNFIVEKNRAYGNGTHGYIFSRGCSGNVLRNNIAFNNGGYGIMIDDGKVRADGNPRHARAVPSDNNRIEDNQLWNNAIGVALEGGSHNVVRFNDIHDNVFGISIKDHVRDSEIVGNAIRASAKFAIYIYDHSDKNHIAANGIVGGISGVVVKDSAKNIIERNRMDNITGRGIVLLGDVSDQVLRQNTVKGRGSTQLDTSQARGVIADQTTDSERADWIRTGPPTTLDRIRNFIRFHPAILLWITIFMLPLLAWIPARWKWKRQRRAQM